MQTIINNKLYANSKLYVEFSKISAEKFAEFFSHLVSKKTLNGVAKLNVQIQMANDAVGRVHLAVNFNPVLKLEERANYSSFFETTSRVMHKLNNHRSFDLFGYTSAYGTKEDKEEYTTLWRQFLTENLGKEFYGYLLALHIKESIEAKIAHNNKECQNLLERLAKNKQEKENLSAEMAKFYHDYADVLEEDDISTIIETLNETATTQGTEE